MKKLWQKQTAAADWVTRFTVGEDYLWDTLLLPYDVAGTRAQAWSLVQAGVLTADEEQAVNKALDALLERYDAGDVAVRPQDEDCHTVIEGYLTEQLGEVGKKIHTGRSRNDQVLTALRLWLRDRIDAIGGQVADVAEVLCTWGAAHDDVLMPGYTHMQRAMPSTVGLWAMGYAELLAADLDGLRHVRAQVNVSPLGSAAGYGVPSLDLPRREAALRMGFDGVQTHVTAVQLSRGKSEAHLVHALVQVAFTLNRLASDLVLYNTAEFGFVKLPAEYCTGSSIMPQKQNPDVLELARATYHRLLAEQQLLLTLPANLPSGYHRDLQLTKEAVMRAVLRAADLVEAMRHLLPGVTFDHDHLTAALSPGLFATAYALDRVLEGQPFREAYRATGAALSTLTVPPAADALATYRTPGGPGHVDVGAVRDRLGEHRDWAVRP